MGLVVPWMLAVAIWTRLDPFGLAHVCLQLVPTAIVVSALAAWWLRGREGGRWGLAIFVLGLLVKGGGLLHPTTFYPDVANARRYVQVYPETRGTLAERGVATQERTDVGYPRTVAGKPYAKGIGTHAVSELVYAIEPVYKQFVALCGTDDEHEGGSVVFAVYIDEKLVAKSDVITKSTKPWQFRIPIPEGSKQLRLVVGDGGDDIGADHADWVKAGFKLTK